MAAIEPAPPRASGRIPFVRAGRRFLPAPTEYLQAQRRALGDTFLVELFGFRLLFTFTPEGLRSLYALPEEDASFAEATRTLIGFKLPDELLGADMRMFHGLFGAGRREQYLEHIEDAVDEQLAELGREGEIELFAHAKRLVHRVGFRCWAGREAATVHLERLIRLFERLDPEEAFVRPARTMVTLASRKWQERRALEEVAAILRAIHEGRGGHARGDMFEELHARHAGHPAEERHRRVARDVMILHLASLSNLYAAIGWTLIDLLLRPERLPEVREDPSRLEACAQESIRVAQRSITLRKVVRPCVLDDGATAWRMQPGVFAATMLSCTNQEPEGMDAYDPSRWRAGRLQLPTRELVSTFGHGRHACPGQRFALSAIRIAVSRHLAALDLEPLFTRATPPPAQIGAVARSADPCRVRYRSR